jgi:hypothetical protein
MVALAGPTSAMASPFISESENTTYAGTGLGSGQSLGLSVGTITCGNASMSGFSAPKTAETLSATVADPTCNFFGSLPMKTNGCNFILRPGAETETNKFDGTIEIGPPGCGPITLKSEICEITIGAQSGLAASFQNSGSGSTAAVTVNLNATKLKYTTSGSFCGGAKTSHEDGTYKASWLLNGNSGGTQKGIHVGHKINQGFYLTGEKSAEVAKQP